ncbi:MAG: hypothetical protein IJN13_05170 [Bacilli bacterium]|nr:hypothetical protein [Bacilli bacterium]
MKNLIKNFNNLEKKDKTMFLLIITTIGSVIIAFIKLIFALTIPSLWFFVNSGFLIVLSLSRFFSIRDYGKQRSIKEEKEKQKIGYKNYLNNGILLIILGIMYFFVSVYMYYKGTNTTMHEYLTYLVALNAFWSISWSIYGMVKYKRKSSPILKAVKITNFANAMTSIVLTQVVLLDTYAKEYDLTQINGYTGMGVSLAIIIMGLYMIINIQKVEE